MTIPDSVVIPNWEHSSADIFRDDAMMRHAFGVYYHVRLNLFIIVMSELQDPLFNFDDKSRMCS